MDLRYLSFTLETCIEFLEASPKSMYNCYKLLGFDVLVDNNLKVCFYFVLSIFEEQ